MAVNNKILEKKREPDLAGTLRHVLHSRKASIFVFIYYGVTPQCDGMGFNPKYFLK